MTLDQLYHRIYNDESTKDSVLFIALFEEHQELVVGAAISESAEIHNQVMRLTADYAHHLTISENFKKAQAQIDRAIRLFESYPSFQETSLHTIAFYNTLVFDRALINYHLMNYKDAFKDLKMLCERFPENIKYKNYLAAVRTYSLHCYINILYYVAGALLLASVFLDEQTIGTSYNYLLYIVILIVAIILIVEAIKKIIWQNIKK